MRSQATAGSLTRLMGPSVLANGLYALSRAQGSILAFYFTFCRAGGMAEINPFPGTYFGWVCLPPPTLGPELKKKRDVRFPR